jgi:hydrogenase maturation protease
MSVGGTVVIGIGNEDRSDDACGRWTARRLVGQVPARVEESEGEATRLLDLWAGATSAIIVDAVRSGAPPGTVHRRSMDGGRAGPHPLATSTHGLGLAEAIGLGRALGRAPPHIVVYGIEVASLAPGRGLTPSVERAVAEVAGRIQAEFADRPGPSGPREVRGHA